jgi:hypothetical protein
MNELLELRAERDLRTRCLPSLTLLMGKDAEIQNELALFFFNTGTYFL